MIVRHRILRQVRERSSARLESAIDQKVEPFRLKRWLLPGAGEHREFYTCARPGRSGGSHKKVADHVIYEWVRGMPGGEGLVVVSLLGEKPNGINEFSYYSFFDRGLSFQDWLDHNDIGRSVEVVERPTIDTKQISDATLEAIVSDIDRLICAGRTIILMDSGGVQRTRAVCVYIGAVEQQVVRGGRG